MATQPRTPQGSFDNLYDEEMERSVIGSVLINPALLDAVVDRLAPDDFFLLRHQYIWEAVQILHSEGRPIERRLLRRVLEDARRFEAVGGDLYLSELVNSVPTAMYGEEYAAIVYRDSVRRRFMAAADKIQGAAKSRELSVEDVASEAMGALMEVTLPADRRGAKPMQVVASDYLEALEARLSNDKPVGLPTSFKRLDSLLGGFQRSDLMIFAGRPGMGKTSFMLSVAANTIRHFGARALIFTLEMNAEQMMQRLASMETGQSMQKIRRGEFTDAELRRHLEAVDRLSQWTLHIDDSPALNPIQMRNKIRRVYHEHGLDLIILDYLQLMHAPGYEGNRVQEISYISRQLKEMAREFNVPLLSAAQLSRAVEQRADKRPQLSDLRESGSLEQDSDIVMFLYRDVVYNEATENPNQADIIVAKHRNGPTDTIPLYFDASSTRFRDGPRQHVDLASL